MQWRSIAQNINLIGWTFSFYDWLHLATVHIVYIEVNTRWNCIKLLVACDSCRSGTWFLDYFYKKVFKLIRATFSTSWIFGYSMKYAMLGAMCCTVCLVSLSLFSSHRKNWFAARCECLHLIKKNLQCLFAWCEFFLIRCKYSQRAANRFLRWREKRL